MESAHERQRERSKHTTTARGEFFNAERIAPGGLVVSRSIPRQVQCRRCRRWPRRRCILMGARIRPSTSSSSNGMSHPEHEHRPLLLSDSSYTLWPVVVLVVARFFFSFLFLSVGSFACVLPHCSRGAGNAHPISRPCSWMLIKQASAFADKSRC